MCVCACVRQMCTYTEIRRPPAIEVAVVVVGLIGGAWVFLRGLVDCVVGALYRRRRGAPRGDGVSLA
jgi:hypothetical protein